MEPWLWRGTPFVWTGLTADKAKPDTKDGNRKYDYSTADLDHI